ncbi:AAA family ATPase [Brevibacterium aurantiacum]|uniref:DNA repair exonuclease SbcCD ATPase subunit n=1 Tax=Brevibacterium aurantiacum TaxID=273384 RepID=A0A2H1K1L0_BREAU|nr:AAA family ATPase [Brevibacterium aurantiacum]SMX93606.1 DNA repair exonuclease SbcCD ATPase subunit [Brevibacterium aurantiacum]
MKFHSIHLRNYRGIADSRVEFGDGVTVVEGPNEVGKSSIHEAITHLREDKASSRKASVKETQPVGVDAGPEVELHLSTGDYELKYRKRWIKQPFTELSVIRPRPEQLSSDDAHDRFLAILAETVDVDLLDALDVAQGESLAQAPLAQIKALHSALNESGVEVADHDDFLDRIEVEYAKYFTKSGKETGDYKAANAEVPSAEAAFEELRERSRGMDELVDNHARAAARLESVRDQLTQAVTDRDQAEQAAKAVAELKAVLDQALEQAKSAQRDEQIAREALDRRTQLIEDVATAEETVTAARTSFTELETTQSDKDSDFDRAQKTLEEKQNALDEARALAKTAAKDVTKARARTELTELTRRLDTIRDHDEKRSRAQATIASIAVTAKNVEALISLETEVRIAENAKTSAAAQIVAKQLGSQSIDVDGTVLGDGATGEFAAVKDVRITIDGIADITVRPGASPVELDKALTSARQAFDAELHRLDVDSVAQARQSAHVRADAEAVKAEADSTLTVLLGDDKRDTLEAALARAQQIVEADGTDPDSRADESNLNDLEAAVTEAEKSAEVAQSEVDTARTELERTRTSRDDARVETVRAQTSLKEAEAQHQRLTNTLSEARTTATDSDLDEAVKTAQSQAESVGTRVEEARVAYEATDPETLEMQLQNVRQLVGSKETQREEVRQEVDRLSALIDDRASEGIYEKLAAAEETMEAAQKKQARLSRQAAAINLLRTTVLKHKEESQRKYVAPFKEQIERLGRLVFGQGLSVEVSEDLEIVSRTLSERTVPFESLSGGTKEQLALIGRLAVATLVDTDSGAPVVLDDAFGFADAERLNALNVILGTVGQSAQVILLTCQPDRFARLGGAKTVSLT